MDEDQASAAGGHITAQGRVVRPDVHYPVILNGLDYLQSAVGHLVGEPTPRDLKYAVLHLQAATEVILKARLEDEHFSLVFKDPGRASYANFVSGSFESCGTKDTINRLRAIAHVVIEDADLKAVEALAHARNALQHYGLTASSYAVEAQAVRVLDFLLTFTREHLIARYWAPPGEIDAVIEALDRVQEETPQIEALIKRRAERVRGILADCLDRTVRCPICREWTAIINRGKQVTCLCCDLEFDGYLYLEVRWDNNEEEFPEGCDLPTPALCRACGERDLVSARTAESPSEQTDICFSCGAIGDRN
ncbi:hypothetical protein [Streptomyces sp. NRRL S-1824]|uniref:hypothetical protein n=1 Tax=Streptomyces sp. NRRL S-1824 TaxID=1463889 RepID=UPI00131DA122|nr:hypothetical protein [Streptomyces sp. NRRL S-1824]